MKLLLATGVILLVVVLYTLGFGKGGLIDLWGMLQDIDSQQIQNERLQNRNRELAGEIVNLQKGTEAIEERARYDLGLIKQGEVFVQIVE
ncbi:MAG TPA: cell division protein FtsB [Gammaproteobacteria bacterium]|nr:cell division protein FtsB [Gammaproteobacteria bacterium]